MAKRDFHIAVVTSNVAMISELITNGRDINELDANGDTPLLRALRSKNENMAVELLRFGADPLIINEKNAKWTAEKIAKKLQLDKASAAIAATVKKKNLVRRASMSMQSPSGSAMDLKTPPPPAVQQKSKPPIQRRGSYRSNSEDLTSPSMDFDRESVTSRSESTPSTTGLRRSGSGYRLDISPVTPGSDSPRFPTSLTRSNSGGVYGYKLDVDAAQAELNRRCDSARKDSARSICESDTGLLLPNESMRKLGKSSSIMEMNPYLPRQVPANRFSTAPTAEYKPTESGTDPERAGFCGAFTCVTNSCVVM